MTVEEQVLQLRAWGMSLARIAVREINYSDDPPICTESTTQPVKCNQGTTHYKVCGKPATQFELMTDDGGGRSWVLRCEEHAVNENWCPSVRLVPPC